MVVVIVSYIMKWGRRIIEWKIFFRKCTFSSSKSQLPRKTSKHVIYFSIQGINTFLMHVTNCHIVQVFLFHVVAKPGPSAEDVGITNNSLTRISTWSKRPLTSGSMSVRMCATSVLDLICTCSLTWTWPATHPTSSCWFLDTGPQCHYFLQLQAHSPTSEALQGLFAENALWIAHLLCQVPWSNPGKLLGHVLQLHKLSFGSLHIWGISIGLMFTEVTSSVVLSNICWNLSSVLFSCRVVLTQSSTACMPAIVMVLFCRDLLRHSKSSRTS